LIRGFILFIRLAAGRTLEIYSLENADPKSGPGYVIPERLDITW